jgi:fucose 4-O-acetylase-like acetyltransferase
MIGNAACDKRVYWVDVLKFLGIFVIYLGHFGKSAGKLYPFVYTYHVPLFFFMSGFFADIKKGEAFFPFVKKKFQKLMVPYFVFVALSILMHAVQYDLAAEPLLFELHRYIFAVRNTLLHSSLWFFSCLFVVAVLYRLLLTITKSKWAVLAISMVPACFFQINQPSWFWNVDSALIYLVYYALGNICFTDINQYRYEHFHRKGKLVYILLVLISVLIAVKTYFCGSLYLILKVLDIDLPVQAEAFFTVFNTSIILFANIQLAFLLEKSDLFRNIGKETLLLCGVEFITKNLLQGAFAMLGIQVRLDTPLMTLLYTALCLAVSYKAFVPLLHKYFGRLLGTDEGVSPTAVSPSSDHIEKQGPRARF